MTVSSFCTCASFLSPGPSVLLIRTKPSALMRAQTVGSGPRRPSPQYLVQCPSGSSRVEELHGSQASGSRGTDVKVLGLGKPAPVLSFQSQS